MGTDEQLNDDYPLEEPVETIACQNGWTFDRSTFPNTVVMEVHVTY